METSLVDNRRTLMHRVCDTCHARKVRCDRQNPCGNCQDQNTLCTRHRSMARAERRAPRPTKRASSANRSFKASPPQSWSKLGSSHGPVDQSTQVLLSCTLDADSLLIETHEATPCSNAIEDCSYSGSVLDMVPSMSGSNVSEDQQGLFAQLTEPRETTIQDWLLQEDGLQVLHNLYPSLNQELQRPNPVDGPNGVQILGPCSAPELHDCGGAFISDNNYLQVHNYFADTTSSGMDDIILDHFKSLAATTELEQAAEAPHKQAAANQTSNDQLLNSDQHTKPNCSFIPDQNQMITLAASNSLQDIPDTDHGCHCWKEL
ncbi:hypothetical protein BDV27DRAFT_129891 [Aspergillus caelatus]|uniref:Zn(2)-C6 fungal-type domain-containing protein n=1 Tax=Aspergillus caelatus TaxID=61420 RepID=A0A5N7A0Y1_9EURO|nr:uncharacterized protein BDV27DRAFT_129891 [Aspergillus caelatus]KAE8363462.1 hypothetical protein BDV27DRAFT_129891 [Aspergillus caelatus]